MLYYHYRKGESSLKNNTDLGQAIGFTLTMSLIFMICYCFEMTQTPFFLLLVSVMSFGYSLCLLAFFKDKKRLSFYLYLFIGSFLIVLCVALSFTTPHEALLFS